MKLVSRQFALAMESPFYFTGKPCPQGHVAKRNVTTRRCVTCQRLQTNRWRKANSARVNAQSRERRANNLESVRAYSRKWQAAHREQGRAANRQWYADNREYEKARQKKMRESNPARYAEYASAYRAAKLSRTPAWADQDEIAGVYATAASRTRALGEPHHVDHVLPLAGKTISGLHVHANLRIVPGTDNSRKSNKFTPYAEHYSPEFAVALIAA